MALGTFTLRIDADRYNGSAETSATVKIRRQGPVDYFVDPDANLLLTPFTGAKGLPVSMPYTVTLPTDATTGTSTTIGYTVTVTPKHGQSITTNFAAPAAGTTLELADAVETIVAPPELTSAQQADPIVAGLIGDTSSQTHAALGQLVATSGDQAARLNTYLAAATPPGGKKLVGNFTINSPVTVPANTYVDMTAATITHTVAAEHALTVGANSKIVGGKIVSPTTWDGANVAWTYAVINVTGSGVEVTGVTLENVPKVGIGFRDVDSGIVRGCRIIGNYPSASWTGTETGHFGVTIDPSASVASGNFVVADNLVESCVQGVFIGNYGAGTTGRGIAIAGNTFYSCWNHGVYGTHSEGTVVTGNAFNRCQYPVALTGAYHVVNGNTMVTGGSGAEADNTGISLRNPIGCTVVGNTIKGQIPSGQIVVNLAEINSGTAIRDNVVANNVIEVTGSGSSAIRIGNGSSATTIENNAVTGNRIRCGATSGQGVITLTALAGSPAKGNQVYDNEIVVTSDGHGVSATNQRALRVRGNVVRWEFDAAAAVTLAGAALTTVADSRVGENDFSIEAAWGTNISIRGVWEVSGCSANRVEQNRYRFDATKTAARIDMVLGSTSGTVIDEAGAGAPNVNAGVGSIWRRTDGGAATTLYVKESGTGATGWVGK